MQMDNNKVEHSGLILVDKPVGVTSFSIDSRLKKILGQKSVGHLGTLDPFASGLLPICVGKGLRMLRFAEHHDKRYLCTARIGYETDTMDSEGSITSDKVVLTSKEYEDLRESGFAPIYEAFEEIRNSKTQIPPKYSAKKINGKKAYELVRAGVEFELKPAPIEILNLEVNSITRDEETNLIDVEFDVSCSKGTYIRVICSDLGQKSGLGGAFATTLRRLKSGNLSVENAYTMEQIEEMAKAGNFEFITDANILVEHMPKLCLNDAQARMVSNGRKLDAKYFGRDIKGYEVGTKYRAIHNGELVAIVYDCFENDKTTGETHHIIRIERMLLC